MLISLVAVALAGSVEVPVDVGIGPAVHLITGPVFADQPLHTGIVISAAAVIDKATIKKFKNQIPKKYQDAVASMDEVRISKIYIPDTLFISPALNVSDAAFGSTGMYGVGWRPISLGIPLIRDPVRLSVDGGVRLTYAFIHSTTIPSPTHFLRPGIDLGAELEIPFSSRFLVSLGWDSQFYPPQEVGGSVLKLGRLDESIWHIGQGYLAFHFRFPYAVNL